MTKCMTKVASITWLPGRANNDEITKYEVYYNSTYDPPGKYHRGAHTRRGRHSAEISLAPYANYTFHVVAFNSIGKADEIN